MTLAAGQREQVYRGLLRRNRGVSLLRLIVPLAGTAIFLLLAAEIYLSSLAGRFGIGQIKVSLENVSIDAPEYAGVMSDGSTYRVTAQGAVANIAHTDIIDMTDAALTVLRKSGTTLEINAAAAQLDTTKRQVIIAGLANVEDSTGTVSRFYNSVFDWSAQTLDSQGPVAVDYADGTKIIAKTMKYDTQAGVWTFSGSTVTLPSTPGAKKP
ncbi:hypothetical protein [Devosia sp.]|uniref:hypothetical protein n=1 Tax=Devosia sp. TaxID=1871048 RepID=UPI0032633FB7